MHEKGEVLVEVKDMCKNFGVTVALNHVDITIRRGEIRGLDWGKRLGKIYSFFHYRRHSAGYQRGNVL